MDGSNCRRVAGGRAVRGPDETRRRDWKAAGSILPFDEEAGRAFPLIAANRREQGRPVAELDAQIAAIAHSRGAILATRNTADFEGCGVRLANPWQDAHD